MVGSNFGIIYHHSGTTGNNGTPPANTGTQQTFQAGNTTSGTTASDRGLVSGTNSLSDFMMQLEDFATILPDPIAAHFLSMSGFQSDDKRIIRLVSLATQKYLSDIIDDALHNAKARTQNNGATTSGQKLKERKFTLTIEDLQSALADYGINVRKMDYSQ